MPRGLESVRGPWPRSPPGKAYTRKCRATPKPPAGFAGDAEIISQRSRLGERKSLGRSSAVDSRLHAQPCGRTGRRQQSTGKSGTLAWRESCGPDLHWSDLEYVPPRVFRGKGFPTLFNVTPNSTLLPDGYLPSLSVSCWDVVLLINVGRKAKVGKNGLRPSIAAVRFIIQQGNGRLVTIFQA